MEYRSLKLEDLINKAGDKKKSKDDYFNIYIKRLDSTIKAKKPNNSLILESLDIAKEDSHEGDLHLLYNSILEPNIKDSNLHKTYGVVRGIEILDEIFTLGEIANITNLIMQGEGYDKNSVGLVEDVKN